MIDAFLEGRRHPAARRLGQGARLSATLGTGGAGAAGPTHVQRSAARWESWVGKVTASPRKGGASGGRRHGRHRRRLPPRAAGPRCWPSRCVPRRLRGVGRPHPGRPYGQRHGLLGRRNLDLRRVDAVRPPGALPFIIKHLWLYGVWPPRDVRWLRVLSSLRAVALSGALKLPGGSSRRWWRRRWRASSACPSSFSSAGAWRSR
jgi:hypothetical protein